jgi:hypothetical protein
MPEVENKREITLKIAGVELHPYIYQNQEEVYRIAAKSVDEAYKRFVENYADALKEGKLQFNEILVGLALQYAVNFELVKRELNKLNTKLNELNLDLKEFLKQE